MNKFKYGVCFLLGGRVFRIFYIWGHISTQEDILPIFSLIFSFSCLIAQACSDQCWMASEEDSSSRSLSQGNGVSPLSWAWCPLLIVWDRIFHLLRGLGNVCVLFYSGGILLFGCEANITLLGRISPGDGVLSFIYTLSTRPSLVQAFAYVVPSCICLWFFGDVFLRLSFTIIIKHQQGGAPSVFSGSLWSTDIIVLLVMFDAIHQWSCPGLNCSLWSYLKIINLLSLLAIDLFISSCFLLSQVR